MQKDKEKLEKDFMNLRKFNKVEKIINDLKNVSTQEEIFNLFMNVKKDFKNYFQIYLDMNKIYNKYKDNDEFIKQFGEEHFKKIEQKINLLDQINVTSIYNYITGNSDDNDDNQPNEEINQDAKQQEQMQELIDNKEFLEQRSKELQQIHKTAAQLKDITDDMAKQLNQQGEKLDIIEENVDKAAENAADAKKEIETAEKNSKKNSKKLCCFLIIIFVALTGITLVLISLLT